jgi:Uncharacterized conserved protein (DUF2358)
MFSSLVIYIGFAFAYVKLHALHVRPSNLMHRRETSTCRNRQGNFILTANSNDDNTKVPETLTKFSWYAVEAFGNMFRDSSSSLTPRMVTTDLPPNNMRETQERIRLDNERLYFLSGIIDELIYSDECVFADPFVSFTGRDRFVKNLANLGSFITEFSAKQLDYTVTDSAVETKFMVKLQLNLPWRPVLAWPWGVRCEIDPNTNLIVLHKESVRTMKLLR